MTAVATTQSRDIILAEVAEKYTEQLAALAPRGTDPAHYIASLRLYMAQNTAVLNCSPKSVAVSILRVAQTGLTLGVSCDILPFGKDAQFSPRYNGIIELALSSGVRAINADVVREGDFFEHQKGTENFLRHRKADVPGGKITHAYAIAEIKVGSYVWEVLTREEVEAVQRQYSRSWKGKPLEDIPWYAKKTALRRLAPYLPKNNRFASALQFDKENEEVPAGEFEVVQTGRTDDGAEFVTATGEVIE